MNDIDLIKKIELLKRYQSETNQIEAKSAKDGFPKKCYDTISSFANTYGGTIIFGIDEENNFEEHDVYDVNDLQSKISSLCSDAMEPVIRPEFLMIEYNGKKLLAVHINEIPQNQKPCYYKSFGIAKGSYIRVGDNDEHMTDYEIYSLQSYKDGVQEDLRPVKRATIDDLDKEKIKEYLKIVKQNKPNLSKNSDEKILKLCGIIESDEGKMYPTLAGILLFAQYPQAFFPQLFVACVAFPGNEIGELGEMGQRFDDNKRIEGTIEEMLEGTLAFLRKNMKNRVIISVDTGKRTNLSEYPMLALKEAVANALVHRDYSISREGTYIQVHMFNDRIVIQNPGALYGNNHIDKLGTDTIMEARNKNIIRILEEQGSIIENRHTGIPTMKKEMLNNNLPEPIFEEIRGDFKVTLKNEFNIFNIDQVFEEAIAKINNQIEEEIDPAKEKNDPAERENDPAEGKNDPAEGKNDPAEGKNDPAEGKNDPAEEKNDPAERENDPAEGKNDPAEEKNDPARSNKGETKHRYITNKKILSFCHKPKTAKEISEHFGYTSYKYFKRVYIKPLIGLGQLEMTIPTKPSSENQKYILKK